MQAFQIEHKNSKMKNVLQKVHCPEKCRSKFRADRLQAIKDFS